MSAAGAKHGPTARGAEAYSLPLKLLRDLLQMLHDGQLLGANALALRATDALARTPEGFGKLCVLLADGGVVRGDLG